MAERPSSPKEQILLLQAEALSTEEERESGRLRICSRAWPVAGLLLVALMIHIVMKPQWTASPATSTEPDVSISLDASGSSVVKLATEGQTCAAACEDEGKECDEDALEAGNYESDASIRAAAKAAGSSCGQTVPWPYSGNPAICTNSHCCGDGGCKGWCMHGHAGESTCNDYPAPHLSRLCPCKRKHIPTLFMMEHGVDPMLVLAATPASTKASGRPAILVMPKAGSDPAFLDFVESYRPEKAYLIGSPSLSSLKGKLGSETNIPLGSLEAVSIQLARTMWRRSPKVVIVRSSSYADALVAAPLAAKLSAPLLLAEGNGPSKDLLSLVKDLMVTKAIFVGKTSWNLAAKGIGQESVRGASQISHGGHYLVVANPADKASSAYTALSAFAPMLAVLHSGVVLPLVGGESISSASVKEQLSDHISLKGIPDNLALFGGFQAIPLRCKKAWFGKDSCVDVPYAQLDNDMFLDVGLGRMIARDLSSMSLLVSRIASYDRIRGDSEGRVVLGGNHKMTMQLALPIFEAAGFKAEMLTQEQVKSRKKIVASAIIHNAHSWYKTLGGFYDYHDHTLLSPSVITSGGCQTAGFFERGQDKESAVLQLLHNGAVAYVGGTRLKITVSSQLHQVFWESLIRGKTLGEAHIEGWNTLAVNNADNSCPMQRYSMGNTILIGDPSFKLFAPSILKRRPAQATEQTQAGSSIITVHGPQAWTKYVIRKNMDPLPEWGWSENLYQYGAPGISSRAAWAGKYDKWWPYFYTKIRTSRQVKSVNVVGNDHARSSLGFKGNFYVDEHGNGNRTVWWRVRMIRYDWETGRVKGELNSQRYRIQWADDGAPTPAPAELPELEEPAEPESQNAYSNSNSYSNSYSSNAYSSNAYSA